MEAAITSKAQITLPKDLRLLLGVGPGDRIVFEPQPDGSARVARAQESSFAALRGILPRPARARTIDEMNEAVAQAAAAGHAGIKRKAQCLDVLERLLGFGALSFESRQVAAAATKAWRSSKADFSDAMIGLTATGLSARHVLTHDKKAYSLSAYRLIA